jgi:DNA-binding transcriptional ArsR family regulator
MTELAQALKTLADETRLTLVKLLLTHDLCVGALAKRLAVSEAAVSQHLGKLREAGLVKGEKRGYWTHYTVEKGKLTELAGLLKDLTMLPSCAEGVCIKKLDHRIDCHKEDMNMCDCKCQHPEKLKGNPGDCTPAQIRECHGDEKKHPCHGHEKGGK